MPETPFMQLAHLCILLNAACSSCLSQHNYIPVLFKLLGWPTLFLVQGQFSPIRSGRPLIFVFNTLTKAYSSQANLISGGYIAVTELIQLL